MEFIPTLVIAAIGWFLFTSWKLALYFSFLLICAIAFHAAKQRAQSDLSKAISKDLRDALIAIAIGVLFVAVAQSVLQLLALSEGIIMTTRTVKAWEESIVSLKDFLSFGMGLGVQLVLWIILLLGSIFTGWIAVKTVADRRRIFAKLLIVLNVACSFTFFSGNEINEGESKWVAKRTTPSKALLSFDQLQEKQHTLVASEAAKVLLQQIPRDQHESFKGIFFDESRSKALASLIEWKAEELAISRSKPAVDEVVEERGSQFGLKGEVSQFLESYRADLEAWKSNPSQAVSLLKVRRFERLEERLDHGIKESEIAVIEISKSILGGLVGTEISDEAVRCFVKAFIGAIAKERIPKVYPKNVDDLVSANKWLMNLFGPRSTAGVIEPAFIPRERFNESEYRRGNEEAHSRQDRKVQRIKAFQNWNRKWREREAEEAGLEPESRKEWRRRHADEIDSEFRSKFPEEYSDKVMRDQLSSRVARQERIEKMGSRRPRR